MTSEDRTTLSHETCHHKLYYLSCEQYEWLLARSAECCEMCGRHASTLPRKKLCIDHEHRLGRWAVRGLVCPPCNQVMGAVDEGWLKPYRAEIVKYLKRTNFKIPRRRRVSPSDATLAWVRAGSPREPRRAVGTAFMPPAYRRSRQRRTALP